MVGGIGVRGRGVLKGLLVGHRAKGFLRVSRGTGGGRIR